MADIKKCKYKIIVDTREKRVDHIIKGFDKGFELKPSEYRMYRGDKSKYTGPIGYYKQDKGLKTGDFTICVQLPTGEQINFQDKVVVERKKDLNEICGNLFDKTTKDEEGNNRFVRELKRAYEQGIKMYVLIEQDKIYSKIYSSRHFRYDEASKVNPSSFIAMFKSLLIRYNAHLICCDKNESARVIHDILYYEAREYLKSI